MVDSGTDVLEHLDQSDRNCASFHCDYRILCYILKANYWMSADQTVYDAFRYGSDWYSALLTVMLLSFIWNLLYLTPDSQFSHSGSSGTCGGSTETAACRWEEVDEPRVGIPGAGKVTNGLDPRVCTTAPRGPGRSHVSSLSHWYAPCTFYTFHEIRLQEPEPWARNAVLVSEGFLHNNRPLWPWVKEKDRERELISWLIAPGGFLNLVCV